MVRVVLLVDGNCHTVGAIGYLRYGIDDQAVVALAIVGSDYIQTISDVEQRGRIVGIFVIGTHCQIFHRQFIGKGIELLVAFLVQCRENANGVLRILDITGFLKHPAHDLRCQRCPTAVLDECNGTVLIIALGQVIDKLAHKGEDLCIISGGRQYQFAVSEGIFHCLRHIAACKIIDNNFRAAICAQFFCKLRDGLAGIAVYRSIGDDNAVLFGLIA